MSKWIIPILALAALVAAAVFFTPIPQIVTDLRRPAEALGETVVIDQPMPPLSVPPAGAAADAQPATPVPPVAADAPLSRQLVIRERTPVKVKHGEVALPPGMVVELSRDQGSTVEVQFGDRRQATRASIPREAVAVRAEAEIVEPPGPFAVLRQKVVDLGRAPASSIAIEAKEVGTGHGVARSYDSMVGSSEKDAFRTKGLTVTVRNLSKRPSGECEITVYWTGRRLADNQLFVSHAETVHLQVDGVSEQQATSWCPLLDSAVTTYDWTNARRSSGSKFDGWFVVVTRDQQMLVGRGATENYNQIIRDSAQLQPLLATWSGSSQHATANRPVWRDERPGKTASPKDTRTSSPY